METMQCVVKLMTQDLLLLGQVHDKYQVIRETDYIHEKNNNLKLKHLKREILTVPNTINVFSLFNQFLENKEHIALIVDEYGGFDGIITMEDIIETLLGLEIIDENDQVVDMQLYAKEKWFNKRDL